MENKCASLEDVSRAIKFYEKWLSRKANRQVKTTAVKNFFLDQAVYDKFQEFADIFGQVEVSADSGSYVFSRALFYKHINAIFKKLDLKSKRSGHFGYMDGSKENIQKIYQLLTPDTGLINTITLHSLMSVLTHAKYYDFMSKLYSESWHPDFDQFQMAWFVLKSMIVSTDVYAGDKTYTVLGKSYRLIDMPDHFLSFFFKIPIYENVSPVRILTGMNEEIAKIFLQKVDKMMTNVNLLTYVHPNTNAVSSGDLPIYYDNRTLILHTTGSLQFTGLQKESVISVNKMLNPEATYTIPDSIEHVFLSQRKK